MPNQGKLTGIVGPVPIPSPLLVVTVTRGRDRRHRHHLAAASSVRRVDDRIVLRRLRGIGDAARRGSARVPAGCWRHAGVRRGGHRPSDGDRQAARGIRRSARRRRGSLTKGAPAAGRLDWAIDAVGVPRGPSGFLPGRVSSCSRQCSSPWRAKLGRRCCASGSRWAAGLSVAHGLVPPHPGPLAAIERH